MAESWFLFLPSHWAEGNGHRKGEGTIKMLPTERTNKQLDRILQSGSDRKTLAGKASVTDAEEPEQAVSFLSLRPARDLRSAGGFTPRCWLPLVVAATAEMRASWRLGRLETVNWNPLRA